MIWEVKEEMSRRAKAEGINTPYLMFTMQVNRMPIQLGSAYRKIKIKITTDRAIFPTLNKDFSKIHADIIEKLPAEYEVCKCYDSVKDQSEGAP